jgi:hypothetical protein
MISAAGREKEARRIARARRILAELTLSFEADHGTEIAFRSGVSGELSQAREALRRAEVLAGRLHDSAFRTQWALADRGNGGRR